MHTLLTWLGNRDLDNMQQDKNAAIAGLAVKANPHFDKIVILANDKEESWSRFESFLKKRLATIGRPNSDIRIYKAHIDSPIDYPSIAKETEKWISKLSEEADTLSINLTSGTPAMTTLSVLIGKGKANTRFLQATPNNELIDVEIPIDFGSEYIRSASRNIAHLATSNPKLDSAFSAIAAKSPSMQDTVGKAKRVARSEVPVLILGETGTGKEVMAQAIHGASLRAGQPLKIVNCGALAPNLVDSHRQDLKR